jgi:hypothetical protein
MPMSNYLIYKDILFVKLSQTSQLSGCGENRVGLCALGFELFISLKWIWALKSGVGCYS